MDPPAISVNRIQKRYGDRTVLDDVTLEVAQGEVLALVGPNGAGKTTLVECIEGLRRPEAGSVSVLGLDPWRDRDALRQVLGAQLQHAALPDKLRVGEAMALYASFYRRPADPDELLAAVGLIRRRDASYGTLSGGQQQRLSIALALAGNPRVVILDELTTGLDAVGRDEVWSLIAETRQRGVTILLVTHDLVEVERLCDRVAILVDGRLTAVGTPRELLQRAGIGEQGRIGDREGRTHRTGLHEAYLALSTAAAARED